MYNLIPLKLNHSYRIYQVNFNIIYVYVYTGKEYNLFPACIYCNMFVLVSAMSKENEYKYTITFTVQCTEHNSNLSKNLSYGIKICFLLISA